MEKKIIFFLPIKKEFIEENKTFFKKESDLPVSNDIHTTIKETINDIEDNITNTIINDILYEKSIKNLMIHFENNNKSQLWPRRSLYNCFWCCHKFDTIPCFIPYDYKLNVFQMKGNFCSFNCTKSYIFNFKDDKWNIHMDYLEFLYRIIYKCDTEIIFAPDRLLLEIFGGYLSIQDFRKEFLYNHEISIIYPPMISIIPQVEYNKPIKEINKKNIEERNLQKILINRNSKKYIPKKLF